MLGSLGRNLYATLVVGTLPPFQDTCNLLELATYFHYHLLRCTADCIHCHATEEEGHHGSKEDP